MVLRLIELIPCILYYFNSLSHWKASNTSIYTIHENKGKPLVERLTNANISGLPPGKGANEAEMSKFFCNHVGNIRTFVSTHPSHTLLEFDISSPFIGEQLESFTGINRSCWGESNRNPLLHKAISDRVPNVCSS